MKKAFIFVPLIVVGTIVLLVGLFFGFLTIVEYRPAPVETVSFTSGTEKLEVEEKISLMTWNIGYAGLGKDDDFFMSGGTKVQPDSPEVSEAYLSGIKSTIQENPAEILFVQEIDTKAKRSWKVNQVEDVSKTLGMASSYAINFKCIFVPFPLPPIGNIESGVSTLTNFETVEAQRHSLPVPFKWPVRIANLKRCFLATRLPVYEAGVATGKELVLVNFHLEAFDDGEGKIAQTQQLMSFLNDEYAKGNYVIAGGDFNQNFPDSTAYPVVWPDEWKPGQLEDSMLDEEWGFCFDESAPSCRSTSRPYNDEDAAAKNWQYYLIDGFIISPNVEATAVKVLDEDFQYSDHNPVMMDFYLVK